MNQYHSSSQLHQNKESKAKCTSTTTNKLIAAAFTTTYRTHAFLTSHMADFVSYSTVTRKGQAKNGGNNNIDNTNIHMPSNSPQVPSTSFLGVRASWLISWYALDHCVIVFLPVHQPRISWYLLESNPCSVQYFLCPQLSHSPDA